MTENVDIETENRMSMTRIETELGLPAGFVMSLEGRGTDWEFAVQVGVLIEAALSRVLIAHLHNEATSRHVRALPLNGRTSKVSLARDLGVLGPQEARAIQALSEVRNLYAHRVENIQRSLAEFASHMTSEDRLNFIRDVGMFPESSKVSGPVKAMAGRLFEKAFRPLMQWGTELVLGALSAQGEAAERERVRREALEQGQDPFTLGGLFRFPGGTKLSDLLPAEAAKPQNLIGTASIRQDLER